MALTAVRAKRASAIIDVLFVIFFFAFIYSQISAFLIFHYYSLLAFALSETITIFLFLFRSKATVVSTEPADFVLAVAGTVAALLFRPYAGQHIIIGDILVMVAVIMQIIALLSLNKSFGVVPAIRGVKTKGLYHFVRHPMYASYCLLYVGYIINNQTLVNFVVFIAAVGLQVLRIQSEERLLSETSEYMQYKKETPWKLIPHVF
jgi:isoprenylcysteine carboxyl methyltransferase (ICMT) family protein YpbQ